jgi:hypothetical protein
VAATCASLCTQVIRRRILDRAQLRSGAGHAFGPALPVALSLAAPFVAAFGG